VTVYNLKGSDREICQNRKTVGMAWGKLKIRDAAALAPKRGEL